MAGDPGERGPRLLVLGAARHSSGCSRPPARTGSGRPSATAIRPRPAFALADRRCIVSTEDEPAIERLAAALELDGLIAPGTDWPVAVAARIAEKLGLPHPIYAGDRGARDEQAAPARALRRGGRAAAALGVGRRATRLPERRLPCVVKAPDRQGQKGLSLVLDGGELAEAVEAARAASRAGVVLVEEYVDGPEVTVIGFSVGGAFVPLAVTDRVDGRAAGLRRRAGARVASPHAEAGGGGRRGRAVEALGIEDGPSYTQLRISAGGPEVIEVAARLGGGHDAELVEAATGVDLNGLALAAALGETPSPSRCRELHASAPAAR